MKRVLDTAVLKREPVTANTSAFKTPSRIPTSLAQLTVGARQKLVTTLVLNPEPAPTTDVSKALRALEPPVRRFHGTKVPLHWFPKRLVDSPGADKFGYTYFGQFVDHDITLDVSSTIDAMQDATTINNMRSPALDLDSMYGRRPALDPYLYRFPGIGEPPTAVRMQLGRNKDTGPGGPRDAANGVATPKSSRSTTSGASCTTSFRVSAAPRP